MIHKKGKNQNTLGKKGATPVQIIVDFWSTVLIVFMIALFFFILMLSSDKRDVTIETKTVELETTNQLLYAIQIPVEFEGKQMPLGEAIAYGQAFDDQPELRRIYKQYIAPAFYPECVHMIYYSPNNKEKQIDISVKYCEYMPGGDYKEVPRIAETIVPAINSLSQQNNGNNIVVRFENWGKVSNPEGFTKILCDDGNDQEIKFECIWMAKNVQCKKKFIDGYAQSEENTCSEDAVKLQQQFQYDTVFQAIKINDDKNNDNNERKKAYNKIIKDWYNARNNRYPTQ